MALAANTAAPPAGTVERWAWELLLEPGIEAKLAAPRPPRDFERGAPVRRLDGPARDPRLEVVERAPRSVRPGALVDARTRAGLLHTFLHHELQAAELMAWALLAFPETPQLFRRGLAAIAAEELVHAGLLAAQVRRLGSAPGDFPIRDWFWQRVPTCTSPAQFVALLGVGFEGANLDHATLWADRLRAAGDETAALVQERIARDEEAHVRFARRWLERFAGAADFETWRRLLPSPLTPAVLRGRSLARDARARAGLDGAFSDALSAWNDPARRS